MDFSKLDFSELKKKKRMIKLSKIWVERDEIKTIEWDVEFKQRPIKGIRIRDSFTVYLLYSDDPEYENDLALLKEAFD